MASAEKTTGVYSGSDLDGLIQSVEFENHQYVKTIEKENQKILLLEQQEKEKNCEITRLQSLITELDEDTKRNHRQLVHNKTTLESLKKSRQLMAAHEDALLQQLQVLQLDNKEQEKRQDETLLMYRNIWADFEAKYKSQQLVKQLKEEEGRLAESEAVCSQTLLRKQLLQHQLQTAQNELDFKDWRRFCVKISEKWLSNRKIAESIAKLLQENKVLRFKLKEISDKKVSAEADQDMETSLRQGDEDLQEEDTLTETVNTSHMTLKLTSKSRPDHCKDDDDEKIQGTSGRLNRTFTKDRSDAILTSAPSITSAVSSMCDDSGDGLMPTACHTKHLSQHLVLQPAVPQTPEQMSVAQTLASVCRDAPATSKVPMLRAAVSAILSGSQASERKQTTAKFMPSVPLIRSPRPQTQPKEGCEKPRVSSLMIPLICTPTTFSPRVTMTAAGRDKGATCSNAWVPTPSALSASTSLLPSVNHSSVANLGNQAPGLMQRLACGRILLTSVSSDSGSAQKPVATAAAPSLPAITSDAGDAGVPCMNGRGDQVGSESKSLGEELSQEEDMDSDGRGDSGSQLQLTPESCAGSLGMDEAFSPFDMEKHQKVVKEFKKSPMPLLPFGQRQMGKSGQTPAPAGEDCTATAQHHDAPVFMFTFGSQEPSARSMSPLFSQADSQAGQQEAGGSFFNFQSVASSEGQSQGASILSIFGMPTSQPSQEPMFSFNFSEPSALHDEDHLGFSLNFQGVDNGGQKRQNEPSSLFTLF